MRFLIRPPKIIRQLYKQSVWRNEQKKPTIYLTFDDGPIPELTPWVLDILKKYHVKATFFCVGENVKKFPDIYKRIIDEGHQTGNHTQNHLKGWKTKTQLYLSNVEECQTQVKSKLFRPPYGRLKLSQFKLISKAYQVIFWDVLSHDYSSKITPEKCLQNSIKYTRNGSIIVFHDNIKAEKNLKHTLPIYINHFLNLNFSFETI
jgi:peptidoglycan/xylan/chitin deacetylase (PgdA/CDA1 family)